MQSISIVIPNYNGVDLLSNNIPFVYRALESSKIQNFEIIVADDASADDSIAFLEKSYPNIIIVKNLVNQGFASNTNTGIFKAQKDLVFILNSDVILTDNYFTPLLPYFDMPDTFGVMGRIIAVDGDKIQDGAKYPDYGLANIVSTKNYICSNKTSLYTIFMSGANSLIDRKKLLTFGGFNELFSPYYAEDVDLGLNAWRAGYKLYYDHNAICRHPNSATIKKEPSDKVKIISKRNKFILHYLHLEGWELWYFMTLIGFKMLFRLLIFDKNYLKSFILFLKLLKNIHNVKNNLTKHRKKTIREICNFIEEDIRSNCKDVLIF